jgi:DNA-binding transcriptional MocR family regulator
MLPRAINASSRRAGTSQDAVASASMAPGSAALTASERGECRRGEFLPAQGGWSLLIDFARHGLAGAEASRRLLAEGVAATSMENWGLEDTARYLRLVIANEPLERLQGVGARFARVFGEAGGSQTWIAGAF